MIDKFIASCEWAQRNWLAIVTGLTVLWSLFLFVIGFSWLYGYWANALYEMHFEINSCWQGITVVGAAIASILGMAKAGWTVYQADSQFNTILGSKEPVQQEVTKEP